MTTKAKASVVDSNLYFVAGTRIPFNQATAPTGWTKDVTAALNDSILRIVTDATGGTSGGSTAFSTFNGQTATGSYTLTTTDIPAHSHTATSTVTDPGHAHTTSLPPYWSAGGAGGVNFHSGAAAAASGYSGVSNTVATGISVATSVTNTGGGGAHSHTISTSIKYNNFIVASKDAY